jgi:membrane-bound serine protease (ClpP class)
MKHIFILSIFLLRLFPVYADNNKGKILVYKFRIWENISPAIARQTSQVFETANTLDADLVLLHMNTYGGTVADADSIRTKILNSKIPVYVFIDQNAASAGALIAIACDDIYMRAGSSLGAATVVNKQGEKMPDKYQSYMRSKMRATAEAHGKDTLIVGKDTIVKWVRDPQIAEAMVDEKLYIRGITDTGEVLTFTPAEAMQHNFCEGIAESIDQVLQQIGIKEYTIVEYHPSFIEKIIGFLVNPVISGILIMAILAGIYFEMQTPGIGFPLGVAILAAVTYFAPLYLEGLAANWEIIIFVLGLVCVGLEIFVLPGFGIAGAAGIILVFSGLTLSLLDNVVFDFRGVEPEGISIALLTVALAIFLSLFLSLYLSKKLFTANIGFFSKLSLQHVQDRNKGFVGVETQQKKMIGKEGITLSVLRPSGKIEIAGEIFDAVAENGFLDAGEKVKVIAYQAAQLHVEKFIEQNAGD